MSLLHCAIVTHCMGSAHTTDDTSSTKGRRGCGECRGTQIEKATIVGTCSDLTAMLRRMACSDRCSQSAVLSRERAWRDHEGDRGEGELCGDEWLMGRERY